MTMDPQHLTNDMIKDTSQWRLGLSIHRDSIDIAVVPSSPGETAIFRTVPASGLTGIESAVYDNPLLLSNYLRTYILVDTAKRMLVPAYALRRDTADLVIQTLWPDEALCSFCETVGNGREVMVSAIDRSIMSFLRRTFPSSRIRQRLSPLVNYLANNSSDSEVGRLYVNIRAQEIDVVYVGQYALQAVNTFFTPSPSDMAYYVTALTSTCGFQPQTDEIILMGSKDQADALHAVLSPYFSNVRPYSVAAEVQPQGGNLEEIPVELITALYKS